MYTVFTHVMIWNFTFYVGQQNEVNKSHWKRTMESCFIILLSIELLTYFVYFEQFFPFCSKDNFRSQLLSRAGRKNKTLGTLHWRMGKTTLHDLWSFCREKNTDPNQVVVYLHSKGSKSTHSQEVKSLQSAYVTTGAEPRSAFTCQTIATYVPPELLANTWEHVGCAL